MADYVDKSVQTVITGLTKHPSPFAAVLVNGNTTTPPDDMPSKDFFPAQSIPSISKTDPAEVDSSPSLLLRRKTRPPLVARISLPASEVEPEGKAEGPRSPPPTEALMSPLPAANTLHAGHTPIFPRSLSPLQHKDDSGESTPEEREEALSGPLTLPAQPGDGAQDRIELRVLDAELEKIAKEQDAVQLNRSTSRLSQPGEQGGQNSRKGSADSSQRSSQDNTLEMAVDGVILKKPPMNMGAPLGQA
ncbi:hypothetical protein CC78DRAFT_192705 [Lojkania enalia]|uniref:Uncharacterized protein n=1 Tax=Lojkania enalia TaxID=147567 RepID=A0A9P4NBI9_9PLEO|nr:hypothetical protein CC78DRAFT_192705 [Didymosphaeria enalia]